MTLTEITSQGDRALNGIIHQLVHQVAYLEELENAMDDGFEKVENHSFISLAYGNDSSPNLKIDKYISNVPSVEQRYKETFRNLLVYVAADDFLLSHIMLRLFDSNHIAYWTDYPTTKKNRLLKQFDTIRFTGHKLANVIDRLGIIVGEHIDDS